MIPMLLSEVRPGQSAFVTAITGTGLFFTRLRSLGVRINTKLNVVREAPLGGALHICFNERENIAVPKQAAACIQVLL